MVFQKKGDGFHGEMNVSGAALHADGSEAGRFEETVKVQLDSQERADAFMRNPFHYEHEFVLLAGSYVFQLKIGSEQVSAPLNIEAWHEDTFGIGGIAFCAEEGDGNLSAGGRTFAMTGGNRFRADERVYFYTEIYGPALTLGYQVVDRNSGEVKKDSGMAGIGGYVRPGSSVVPFATALPVGGLGVGLYRLEVRVSHSSDADVVMRSVDFEVSSR